MSDDRFEAYQAKCDAAKALAAEALPGNKAALFEALAAANIASVVVDFDGCGDSGQIERITARNANDAELELPTRTITIQQIEFESSALAERNVLLRDFIEHMAYDFPEATHAGWENNDGAFGEFVFLVEEGAITLDYNERYTEYNSYSHGF